MHRIKIGDTVEWRGDALGGSNQGTVIERDEAGLGTPVLLVQLKDGRRKKLPEKCCRKVVKS